MLPLLPFAVGLLTGAAAIKLWRNESTQAGIDKAQEKLRQASNSGLAAIKNTSAVIRERFAPEAPPVAAPSPKKSPPRTRKPRTAKVAEPAEAVKPAAAPKKARITKTAKAPVAKIEGTG